jgi:hypothetical protein
MPAIAAGPYIDYHHLPRDCDWRRPKNEQQLQKIVQRDREFLTHVTT